MTDGMNFEVIDGPELARRCFAGTEGRMTRLRRYFAELKVIEEGKNGLGRQSSAKRQAITKRRGIQGSCRRSGV